jgi:uncharacterized protein YprB with RNaseH-like and TPR domain
MSTVSLPGPDWAAVAPLVAKRSVFMPSPGLPITLFRPLGILVPDLLRYPGVVHPGNLLFFDLETTGLSTGPGTIAFLAALGRVTEGPLGEGAFRVDQYLLLDYPGECDFLEAVLGEFAPESLVVSYNG